MRNLFIGLIFFCVVLGFAGRAEAVTINVPWDYGTIQGAIDAAVDGDEVVVADGTYVENIDFSGKAITVRSENGPEVTIIDGNANGSTVTFDSGEGNGSVLEGFTVTNGTGRYVGLGPWKSGQSGGGIFCKDSSPVIRNCIISGNRVPYAGGGIVFKNSSSAVIVDSVIRNNRAGMSGGGVTISSSSVRIENCTIEDNIAASSPGGIECGENSSVSITDSIIQRNVTESLGGGGAGIGIMYSSAVISNSTISSNSSVYSGGGIYCYFASSVIIKDSVISNNTARSHGGGIYSWGTSSLEILNNTITGNTAGGEGGGIRILYAPSSTTIRNNTISKNTAGRGGGISTFESVTGPYIINNFIVENSAAASGGGISAGINSHIVVINSTVANNSGNYGISGGGSRTVITNSILWGNGGEYIRPGMTYCNIDDAVYGIEGEGNISEDPLFAGNGDYHLKPGSPCIDAGTSQGAPSDDIDKESRPQRIKFDIGADEVYVEAGKETSANQSNAVEDLLVQRISSDDITVTGDLTGSVTFSDVEMVTISTGAFSGKGFFKGAWQATIENASYQGDWQGVTYFKEDEKRIYLKGSSSGDLSGTVEGYLSKSTEGSNTYDLYKATWKIGYNQGVVMSANLSLEGSVADGSEDEFSGVALYILQSNIEGPVYGDYEEFLNIVLTHIRVVDENNLYNKQGFSIISYVAASGSGQGWTYDKETAPAGIIELNGAFTGPVSGIAAAVLDEREIPREFYIDVVKTDTGLPPSADLEVKTWGPQRVSPGQTVDYLIEYRNDGVTAAEDTVIFFELDPLMEYISSTYSYYNEETNEVRMDLGTVAAKASGLVRVTARLPWGLEQGTELKNSARVSTTSKERDLANIDTAAWRQDIQEGDLVLEHDENSEVYRYLDSYWTHGGGIVYGTKDDWWTDGKEGYFVIEALPNYYENGENLGGVIATPVEKWDYPANKEVAVVRVENITSAQRDYIVDFWKQQVGKSYQYWLKYAFKDPDINASEWYCSELQWAPYYNLGMNLDSFAYVIAVAPVEIYDSAFTVPVAGGSYNFSDSQRNQSQWPSTVITARDPNIKYGPEGNVVPGQKIDYRVEYENEGEGIAYGVYFTDILDESLDDTTLDIGPVISTADDTTVIAPAGTYDPETRTITWFVGEVEPNEGGYSDFSINVREDLSDNTEIINFATVYFPSVPEETRTNGIVNRVRTSTDNIPPVTQISISPPANAAGWHNTDVTVTLTATDDEGGSGVREIFYSLTGAGSGE